MINVLIVNDSPTTAEFLMGMLGSDPEIVVAGVARNGLEAVTMTARKRPDVIAMDVHMPGIDGFEATRLIMENTPVPIVIVSGGGAPGDGEKMVFRAAESGALAFVREPAGFSDPEHARQAAELRLTIKTMAQVRVVKRWLNLIRRPAAAISAPRELPAPGNIGLVAIGASTGGPVAIKAILSRLPAGLSAPILLVQHISPGFVEGFAQWLDGATPLKVSVAAHGETALPGHVYVAPDGRHLTVGRGPVMLLVDGEPENGLRPSVSRLFRSVAATYGKDSVGVLLTGMGEDGAAELKTMHDAGAVTIAQDSESALINGMPGAAVRAGAAAYVLSPEGIASAITALAPAGILGGRL